MRYLPSPRGYFGVVLPLLVMIGYQTTLRSYDIPHWYRAYNWSDEPRFSEAWLSQINMTFLGGSHAINTAHCRRLSLAEIWFDGYQNIAEGFFIHTQIPWSWQRLHIGNDEVVCASICVPTLTFGYAINYEETKELDFVDITPQIGIIIGSPPETVHGYIPRATSTSPGLFTHIAASWGLFDWATLGAHIQGIGYANHALYSGSIYAQADHIIPTLSCSLAFTVAGQSGTAHTPCRVILPWYMGNLSINFQVDTATDEKPSRPFFHIFCNLPLGGHHIIGTSIWGGSVGLNVSWCW